MSPSLFDVTILELPSTLPVLPFSGSFLFPNTKINLRIYEMRYIRLVFNALAENRMIGLVQPKEQDMPMKVSSLYQIGCAGRISGFFETEDTLHLTLTGVSRFKIGKENDHNGIYKDATVDFKPFAQDFNIENFKFNRKELFSKLDVFTYSNKIDLNSKAFQDVNDAELLMTLASLLPFSVLEKQALLECVFIKDFYDALLLLLDIRLNRSIN